MSSIVCRRRSAPELAFAVFENKDQLGEPGRYATNIEPPSTDKDAAILAHPGVAEYVDDETKTFFDRYSDMIYIGMSVASIVGSIFLALYSTVTRVSPVHAGHLADEIIRSPSVRRANRKRRGRSAPWRSSSTSSVGSAGGHTRRDDRQRRFRGVPRWSSTSPGSMATRKEYLAGNAGAVQLAVKKREA